MNKASEKVTFIFGVVDFLRDAFRCSKFPNVIFSFAVIQVGRVLGRVRLFGTKGRELDKFCGDHCLGLANSTEVTE
jgi:hypothetical protein